MTVDQFAGVATLAAVSFYIVFMMVCNVIELRWKWEFHKVIMAQMAEAKEMRQALKLTDGKIIDM